MRQLTHLALFQHAPYKETVKAASNCLPIQVDTSTFRAGPRPKLAAQNEISDGTFNDFTGRVKENTEPRTGRPNLVNTDLSMPNMDGLEQCRRPTF
jgi:CheY-like chemotaxis protein